MAVVLSSEENSYFSSSTLRRSHSQPKFVTKHTGFHTSSSASRIGDLYHNSRASADSVPSSAPSSPRAAPAESADLSCTSTPASNFSLCSDCEGDDHLESAAYEEHIFLPQYDEVGFFNHVEDLEAPPSPRTGDSFTASPNDHDESSCTTRPGSPELLERAEDDIALQPQPSRHVDYLSHNWREEDIWSSWKHIISRRNTYTNSARLENASWRTWMKAKNKLRTVSPETLNWLKDCDVTWLYGPLQTGTASLRASADHSSVRLSKSNSFVNKKPILKKRSMSEIMLQRSLSSSSLVKQAAAAVQAQQKEGGRRLGKRPVLGRAVTDYITFPFSSRRDSGEPGSRLPSVASSGIASPSGEGKHIHFNEQVAQCIAVDVKGDDEEEDDAVTDRFSFDSDSDDGAIMMKRTTTKKKRPILKKANSSFVSSGESKTIAMLPSTTLKYREDTPEPTESALKHSTGIYSSPHISPSSSQETLRPSKKSGKLFFDDDDDDDDDDDEDDVGTEDEGPRPGNNKDSSDDATLSWRTSAKLGEGSSGLHRSASAGSLNTEPVGMHRTESGMFMPYEEGVSTSANDGIFSRVIETVNTARDIAHVIWNVGWRK